MMPARTPVLLQSKRFSDARGWFMETFSEVAVAAEGINERFVQDNHSFSAAKGTVRGLHFQRPPHAQAKLVRCLRGAIMDYAVDIRRGSPTYGRYVSARLTSAGGEQLFVPIGFAHGFVTLEPEVEVGYKVSNIYAPDHDGGVAWDDPDIGIDWPVPASGPVLSDKDRRLPMLRDLDTPFLYQDGPLEELVGARDDVSCAS